MILTEHQLFHFPSTGQWRCSQCNLLARTESSLQQLRSGSRRVCDPSALARWQAGEFFRLYGSEAVPLASQSVQTALRAADGVLGAAIEPPRDEEALAQFRALAHEVEQSGKVVFCSKCSAFCLVPGGTARGLLAPCLGRSAHPSTRASQVLKIKYASRGFHPKSGEAIP